MKRKHFENTKPDCGIDDDLGADYTKRYRTPMDNPSVYPGQRSKESSYAGKYTTNDSGLTRTDNFEGPDSSNFGGSGSRSLYDDIMENDRPGGNFDSTGPIRSGINKKQ